LHPGLVLEVGGGEAALGEDAFGKAPISFNRIEGAAVSAIEDEFDVLVHAALAHQLGLVDAKIVHEDVQALGMLYRLPQLSEKDDEVMLIQRLRHQLYMRHVPLYIQSTAYGHGFETDSIACGL